MSDIDFTIQFVPHPTNPRFVDYTGQRFNRILVLGYAGKRRGYSSWWVKCDCGTIKQISCAAFTNKVKPLQSCGCARLDGTRRASTTHGETTNGHASPEYSTYCQAKARCQNHNTPCYRQYGGRGIEFRFESFEEFLDEVGRKPTPAHSLDRYPNNETGHYEKGNVRWATRKQQARHTRRNRLITVDGITKCESEWAENLGLRNSTLNARRKAGWCTECTVTLPFRKKCPHRVLTD